MNCSPPINHRPQAARLSPPSSLLPGARVDIDLEVFVNRSTAPDLNLGLQQIEDILVLHLERGKDYFLSITGNYLASCYGTPISTLCQLREPIRDMPLEAVRALVGGLLHALLWLLLFILNITISIYSVHIIIIILACKSITSLSHMLWNFIVVIVIIAMMNIMTLNDVLIEAILSPEPQTKGGESSEVEDKPLGIPKEIWMMVDHLFRNAIKQVGRTNTLLHKHR